jgi:hypothetical protein
MKDLDEGQYGYKMIVKDLIRHYPEVFVVDGQQEHFWTKAISQVGVNSFRRSYLESFIMTERACNLAVRGSVDEIRDGLYQEHITPVQYIFEKLKGLRDNGNLNLKNVKRCMVQNKLVLLCDDEKQMLDGKVFNGNDLDRLQQMIDAGQCELVDADVELADARKLVEHRYGSKSAGSGMLRICKLLASGIQFCDMHGNECSDERLVRLLVQDFKKEYTTS